MRSRATVASAFLTSGIIVGSVSGAEALRRFPRAPPNVQAPTPDSRTSLTSAPPNPPSPTSDAVQTSPPVHQNSSTHGKLRLTDGQIFTIVGVVGSFVLMVAIVIMIVILVRARRNLGNRRRLQQRWRSNIEIHSIGSSVGGKEEIVSPDPFITDDQARRMGYDLSRIPTRRIEAQFALMDPRLGAPRSVGAPLPIIVTPFRSHMSFESSSTLDDDLTEECDAQLPVLERGAPITESPRLMTPVLAETSPPSEAAVQEVVSQPEGEHPAHVR